MKHIVCSGSPREMGRQYGEQAREEIKLNCDLLQIDKKICEAGEYFAEAEASIRYLVPELFAELEGLAEGCGLSLRQMVCCNHYNPGGPTVGCTPMAVAAGPDGPLIAKNNDGSTDEARSFVVHETHPETGFPVITVTYAGWLSGLDACNAAGVAATHGSVGSIFPRDGQRIDIRLWTYGLLRQCGDEASFTRRMTEMPLTGKGFNIVVGDRLGQPVVLEAAVPVVGQRSRGNPFVFATNHFLLPELCNADRRTPAGKEISTYRFGYLRWVEQSAPPQSLAELQKLLSCHDPWAPCRHGGPHVSRTLWSMIALPREHRVLVADGAPCENPYKSYELC